MKLLKPNFLLNTDKLGFLILDFLNVINLHFPEVTLINRLEVNIIDIV